MISLKWFKSAIERTIEKVVENKIEQAFNELDNEEGQQAPSYPTGKPYLNIKMVNDTLTIVMLDGSILTKSPANAGDFNAARDCRTESCLLNLVSSPEVREERRKAEMLKAQQVAQQQAILAQQQAAQATQQKQAIAAPYQQTGQQLVGAAQRGELTAANQQLIQQQIQIFNYP